MKLLPMNPSPPVTNSFMFVSLVWGVVPVPWFAYSWIVFPAIYCGGDYGLIVPGSPFFVWVLGVVEFVDAVEKLYWLRAYGLVAVPEDGGYSRNSESLAAEDYLVEFPVCL